ncbi:hypothetical protein [Haliangium sp.]|uniref:hypothetical protein n=1 Tax=Haliangium sp. TaxID=2663208 RepID=UPI003D0C0007
MSISNSILRDITCLGLSTMVHSATIPARSHIRTSHERSYFVPFHRADVAVKLADGRILIGRLHLADDHVVLYRSMGDVPCRYRFRFDAVVSCRRMLRPLREATTVPLALERALKRRRRNAM